MKRNPWIPITIAGAALLISGCGPYGANSKSPGPVQKTVNTTRKVANKGAALVKRPGTAPRRLKVIAFYDQTMSSIYPDPFALIKSHPGIVTYLSPFWYEVSASGSIIAKPQGNAPALAQQDHLPLMPLFNNAAGNDAVLHSSRTQSTAIHNIVSLVEKNNYAGVTLDFQLLKPGDRADLTKFVSGLRHALPAGKFLSMSVLPYSSTNGSSLAYNYKALNSMVNGIILMAYDHHSNGTPPGPVSPYPWVVKSVKEALHSGIAPSKLYLGIANYGYLWTAGSTKATTIPLKTMHQHKYGAYTWNPTQKEAYDTYTSGGVHQIIWFVNDKAAEARIRLAQRMHLAGVAFWRIGYEDNKWWTAVDHALTGRAGHHHKGGTHGTRHPATSPQHTKKP